MTEICAVSISQEEGDRLFKTSAKANVVFFTIGVLAMAASVGVLFGGIISVFITGVEVVTLLVLTAVVLSTVFGVFGYAFTYMVYTSAKEMAVKQCLAVAEKIGCRLSNNQIIELVSSTYAQDVFETFVGMFEDLVPDVIPKGFFAGAGGVSEDSRRSLIEHLWRGEE